MYSIECPKVKSNGKLVSKVKETRMLKLLESQVAQLNKTNSTSAADDSINDLEDEAIEADSTGNTLTNSIGIEQLNTVPLYTQILAKIEQSGRDGISLKKLGHLFGFDFYKARRLGTNLQSHPELVTVMKDTNGGRAKFQNLVMRRLLTQKATQFVTSEIVNAVEGLSVNESLNVSVNKSLGVSVGADVVEESIELVLIKQDNQTTKPIQAVMSDRTVTRKNTIHAYLEKNRICTKYEIDKEIRKIEAESGLKGKLVGKRIC